MLMSSMLDELKFSVRKIEHCTNDCNTIACYSWIDVVCWLNKPVYNFLSLFSVVGRLKIVHNFLSLFFRGGARIQFYEIFSVEGPVIRAWNCWKKKCTLFCRYLLWLKIVHNFLTLLMVDGPVIRAWNCWKKNAHFFVVICCGGVAEK